MKVTNTTLMVGFETEVKLGNSDAIELTLQHQAFLYRDKNGKIDIDIELSIDITNVKFLGIEIEEGYKSYGQFKDQLKELGIDLDKLIDEKEKEMVDDQLETKLKLMFGNQI